MNYRVMRLNSYKLKLYTLTTRSIISYGLYTSNNEPKNIEIKPMDIVTKTPKIKKFKNN